MLGGGEASLRFDMASLEVLASDSVTPRAGNLDVKVCSVAVPQKFEAKVSPGATKLLEAVWQLGRGWHQATRPFLSGSLLARDVTCNYKLKRGCSTFRPTKAAMAISNKKLQKIMSPGPTSQG